MVNTPKRQKLIIDGSHEHRYKVDDLVGLRIKIVDKSNVTETLLPCKITRVELRSNEVDLYELCTSTAMISGRFCADDLVALSTDSFYLLVESDSRILPIMTLAQAYQTYTSSN